MHPLTALSLDEQSTLRRVALGLTEVDFARFHDLERLRALHLISSDARNPALTRIGERRHDALPLHGTVEHPMAAGDSGSANVRHDRRVRR